MRGNSYKHRQKSIVIFTAFLIFSFCILSLVFSDQAKALIADNMLRPFIGNTKTVTIEAAYLNAVDKTKTLKNGLLNTKAESARIINPAQTYGSSHFGLDNIRPLLTDYPVQGEGVWDTVKTHAGTILLAKTFLRVDPHRPTSEVTIVKMNMNELYLHLAPEKGKIPSTIIRNGKLIAAFNGGFQQKDGHYGFVIDNRTYLPLKNNLATLVIPYHGQPRIIQFNGQRLNPNEIEAIRQNCPMLIENAVITTNLPAWNTESWGLTITNSMFTWRSGLGVTRNGNLIYAAGPSLTPKTLAIALQKAGAINAMQLDINFPWTRYSVFTYRKGVIHGKPVNWQMEPNQRYFTGYNKDFFYVTRK
ncbi:MAG: phosphodiester glycosidase family protein [Patescibacteria group bacterium]|nr:phosphodiester glycosidase family protein [Patescibacteria group bacterium]